MFIQRFARNLHKSGWRVETHREMCGKDLYPVTVSPEGFSCRILLVVDHHVIQCHQIMSAGLHRFAEDMYLGDS